MRISWQVQVVISFSHYMVSIDLGKGHRTINSSTAYEKTIGAPFFF
jgi:hypothetical protein